MISAGKMNPLNWNANIKTLLGLLAILGSIAGAARYIGEGIYSFSKMQTTLIEHVRSIEKAVIDLHNNVDTGLQQENRNRAVAIDALKNSLEPRITSLEKDANDAKVNTAAARQRVDDIAGTINEIKGDVKDALSATRDVQRITKSHDEDIRATREAVAPKIPQTYR